MKLWLPGVRVWGGTDLEYGTDTHILLYLKWTTNKDLVYSTKNTAQYSVTDIFGAKTLPILAPSLPLQSSPSELPERLPPRLKSSEGLSNKI